MSLPMLPLRELRRRPSRFIVATVVLSFLATLLLFLGGLLDGLYLGSTGAIRAQQGDVETGLVFTGANMWKIKEILPVKEIFRRLKEDIEKI